MESHKVVASAPAKVNLHLSIGDKRPDGYHEVVNLMVALELADEIAIVLQRDGDAAGVSLSCDPPLDFPMEDNLVYRAIRAYAENLGRPICQPGESLSIHIDKLIPMKAGLGGGSSDAAAALAACAALWGDAPTSRACIAAAESIGSDVPFFLYGACALMNGHGEKLVETFAAPSFPVVVLNSGAGSSTVEAYAALDENPRKLGPVQSMIDAVRAGDDALIASLLGNSFQEVIAARDPEVARRLSWLRQQDGVLGLLLSGSGSSCFAICESTDAADRIGLAAASEGFWACSCETSDRGADVICDTRV